MFSANSRRRPSMADLLVPAHEDHSCKRPAPFTNTFSASRGCPLTGASAVYEFLMITNGCYVPNVTISHNRTPYDHLEENRCKIRLTEPSRNLQHCKRFSVLTHHFWWLSLLEILILSPSNEEVTPPGMSRNIFETNFSN